MSLSITESLEQMLTNHRIWIESDRVHVCRADLSGLDLSQLNLEGVKLRQADLRGVCLRGAKLTASDFRETELQRADLSLASLQWVNFAGGDLLLADLVGFTDRAQLSARSVSGWRSHPLSRQRRFQRLSEGGEDGDR